MAAVRPSPAPSVSPVPPQEQERNGEPREKTTTSVADPKAPVPRREPYLEAHYDELVKTIAEIGRDVKPAYTNSKISTDRLRKNIMVARGVLRECLGDLEKLYGGSSSERTLNIK